MIKNQYFFFWIFILLVITNCSFDTKSGIWTGDKKIAEEKEVFIRIDEESKIIKEEINSKLIINIKEGSLNKNWFFSDVNLKNNIPHLLFNGSLKNISKFKFKKSANFEFYSPEILLSEKYIIFYDNNGFLVKYNSNKEILWKTRISNKKQQKNITSISLALLENTIYGSDNLGKYFALDLNTGKLKWEKKHINFFNSQIKVKNKKIFLVDIDDNLICLSAIDGNLLWHFETESSLIKTTKKASIIISEKYAVFVNSRGTLSKLNLDTGYLVWQLQTQNTLINNETNFLKNSELVYSNNELFLSNNKNGFYSIDFKTGTINWKQKINSSIRPIILDSLVLTINDDGYLIAIDANNGNIVRATYLLDKFNKRKKKKLLFESFVVASKKAYITTNRGYILICSISNGKVDKIFRLGNSKLSQPFVANNRLYIVKNNSISVLN